MERCSFHKSFIALLHLSLFQWVIKHAEKNKTIETITEILMVSTTNTITNKPNQTFNH